MTLLTLYRILAFISILFLVKKIKERKAAFSEKSEETEKENDCSPEWKDISELTEECQRVIIKNLTFKKKTLVQFLVGFFAILFLITLWLVFGNIENSEGKFLGIAFAIAFQIVLLPFIGIAIAKYVQLIRRGVEFQEGVIEEVVERDRLSQNEDTGAVYYRRSSPAQAIINRMVCNFLIYPKGFNPMAFKGDHENDWIIGQPAFIVKLKGATTSVAQNVVLVSTLLEQANEKH